MIYILHTKNLSIEVDIPGSWDDYGPINYDVAIRMHCRHVFSYIGIYCEID